jgi:phosphate transport system substrate-binding protein
VKVNGADYVAALVGELAKTYMTNHAATITTASSNSNQGIAALAEDTAQIALSSRALKDAEKSTFAGMKEQELCKDGIAIVVGKDSPITALTAQQVKDIFTNTVKDWGDVGGTAGTISVYTMKTASDVRKAFNSLFLGKDEKGAQADTVDSSNTTEDSSAKMIEALAGDASGVGYMQLSAVPTDGSVKVVDIDGVKATAANITSGTYPYALSFNLITNGNAEAQAFVDYCLGSEAKQYMSGKGYIVP